MNEFKNCEHICKHAPIRENKLCCPCMGVTRKCYCESCNYRMSNYENELAKHSEIGVLVLTSGIHYWYKLKYEFSLLKYLVSYHKDFNVHDKDMFARMKHTDEFFLFVRDTGTSMMDLEDWRRKIFKYQLAHPYTLINTFKYKVMNNYWYFYGSKGKIELLPKRKLIAVFKKWLKDQDLLTYKISDLLFDLEWK